MRLVVFGSLGPHAALLGQHRIRALMRAMVDTGRVPPDQPVPPEAFETGLLAGSPDAPRLGSRVLRPPTTALATTRAAGIAVADVLRGYLARIRHALVEDPQVTQEPWESVGLLVLGGMLLDLAVGERLRASGLVGPVEDGWRVWALGAAPTVGVGMRCDHDSYTSVGAGIMWIDADNLATHLPRLADVDALLRDDEPTAARAMAMLRLRHEGWLDGPRRCFVLLDRDGALADALDEAAAAMVDAVYRPFITDQVDAGDAHSRLMVSRMLMEHCLADLVGDGTVSHGPHTVTRFTWRGPAWLLLGESGRDRKLQHVGR